MRVRDLATGNVYAMFALVGETKERAFCTRERWELAVRLAQRGEMTS
jgi:hypothetical protein